MTEITITIDKDELVNQLKHFAIAINSIGAIDDAALKLQDYIDDLAEDLITSLTSDSEETKQLQDAPEPLVGYILRHRTEPQPQQSALYRTKELAEEYLNTWTDKKYRKAFIIVPLKEATS